MTLGAKTSFSALPNDALVGMFDSGLGGLTVLGRLLHLRPGQPCIYVADTARVPYGGRSEAEIRSIAAEVASYLKMQNCQALLMACNTTNALALDVAQENAGAPVVGLIDSVAKRLRGRRIGVLATPATAKSGAYGKALRAANGNIKVLEVGCPFFVPAVELNDLGSPQLRAAAKNYLQPLLAADVEAIVLGCTHYPLLEALLRDLIPTHIELVDPALAAVDVLSELLAAPILNSKQASAFSGCRLLVTGDPKAFAVGVERLLGFSPKVEHVSLQQPG